MSDRINIGTVETMINNVEEAEISDISKIIRQMIKIKNQEHRCNGKKTKPYKITDKIELNRISYNVASRITKYHIETYDIIDDAIACLAEYEPCIREDLYDYYYEVYIDTLIKLDISGDDFEIIINHTDEIYNHMLKSIRNQIFEFKKTDIPTNKQITYIGAITAYVFYKCKFLIPIESADKVLGEH